MLFRSALLTGNAPLTRGTMTICGMSFRPLQEVSQKKHLELGVSYIPGDRQADGLVMSMSITDNILLDRVTDQEFTRVGFIDFKAMTAFAKGEIERFDIRPTDPHSIVSSLSGGNQQKVVLSKWLMTNPRVLILDEPTRGIDVGAKYEIYSIINNFAKYPILTI